MNFYDLLEIIEPLGVHPDFQQLGLSQALMVETYSFSEAALNAYEAAGFEVVTHELKFYKEY